MPDETVQELPKIVANYKQERYTKSVFTCILGVLYVYLLLNNMLYCDYLHLRKI